LNAKVEAYKSEGHRHESMEEYMQNGDGVTNHVHLRRAEDEDGRWTGRWDWSPYYLTRWQLPGMESGAL